MELYKHLGPLCNLEQFCWWESRNHIMLTLILNSRLILFIFLGPWSQFNKQSKFSKENYQKNLRQKCLWFNCWLIKEKCLNSYFIKHLLIFHSEYKDFYNLPFKQHYCNQDVISLVWSDLNWRHKRWFLHFIYAIYFNLLEVNQYNTETVKLKSVSLVPKNIFSLLDHCQTIHIV